MSGENSTAGIFATYPGKHLTIVNGFFDQVVSVSYKYFSDILPQIHDFSILACLLNTDHWYCSTHSLHSGYRGSLQQPNPPGTGGFHCWVCGSGHWIIHGLQLWLRC